MWFQGAEIDDGRPEGDFFLLCGQYRVQGTGYRVQGTGYRGTGYRGTGVQGTGYRVQGTGYRVQSSKAAGYRAQGIDLDTAVGTAMVTVVRTVGLLPWVQYRGWHSPPVAGDM